MSERRYTQVGSARIHSLHAGDGPDVVLLHGLSGSRHWWRFTLAGLAGAYRVHVPELVGFGRSRGGWHQPGIGELAQLVAGWMEAQELSSPHVVGHSMGGQVALHLAGELQLPLRSLALVAASGIPRPLSVATAARLVAGALPPRHWGAFGFLPTLALDALRSGPRRLALASWQLLADDVRPLLPRVRLPVLLVWGGLDPLVPLEHGRELLQGLPRARLVVVADAAHNVMADRPAEFNALLLDFLDEVERERAGG